MPLCFFFILVIYLGFLVCVFGGVPRVSLWVSLGCLCGVSSVYLVVSLGHLWMSLSLWVYLKCFYLASKMYTLKINLTIIVTEGKNTNTRTEDKK